MSVCRPWWNWEFLARWPRSGESPRQDARSSPRHWENSCPPPNRTGEPGPCWVVILYPVQWYYIRSHLVESPGLGFVGRVHNCLHHSFICCQINWIVCHNLKHTVRALSFITKTTQTKCLIGQLSQKERGENNNNITRDKILQTGQSGGGVIFYFINGKNYQTRVRKHKLKGCGIIRWLSLTWIVKFSRPASSKVLRFCLTVFFTRLG